MFTSLLLMEGLLKWTCCKLRTLLFPDLQEGELSNTPNGIIESLVRHNIYNANAMSHALILFYFN
jgi:hypothetical protein